MLKRKSILFVFPLIALVLMSCNLNTIEINRKVVRGDGNVTTQERSVSGFTGLSLSGLGDVEITQDDSESLTIKGESNLMEYITTEVRGSTLEIGMKENVNIIPTQELHFDLHVKSLDSIAVSGVSNINVPALEADHLTLTVSGAGNANMRSLQATSLNVRSSGTGNFNLAGKVDTQDITISGAGNYSASDLQSRTANIKVSGAGNSQLWATDSLDVVISGFGRVEYYGDPNVHKDISGAGEVKSMGNR